ncbi:hypothetical protein Y032_0085g1868 [Ancylostoma ceylanicum]|uniref:Uncharacterized protein n=1 Tax=Ancylostoma ceylanicum TaxID=53326 RepID=A0A016TQK7_9BILA|nr:hypothetical protein Y032_0085g1868 [Ancylostoma ceylanicum]
MSTPCLTCYPLLMHSYKANCRSPLKAKSKEYISDSDDSDDDDDKPLRPKEKKEKEVKKEESEDNSDGSD